MNVSAVVAGYEATWRFRHSRKLDAWLTSQPWRGRGGVFSVRVASPVQTSSTIAALTRAARAADEHGDVRVLTLGSDNLSLGIRTAVGCALELPSSLGRGEFTRRIIEEMHRPHLFIAEPIEGRKDLRNFEDAVSLCDDIERISPGSATTILLMEIPSQPLSSDFMDLSVGSPADGLLELLDGPESELWRAYVHVRLAWEAAGNLASLELADQLDFSRLSIGDDNSLEQKLNQFAVFSLERFDRDAIEVADRFLGESEGDPNAGQTTPSRGELEALGFFWRPAGELLSRPAPWWARAILHQNRAVTLRYLLRSCLVCAPIAREILLRCFDLEALDRASHPPQTQSSHDAETLRRFDSFLRGDPNSEVRHYPRGCPAKPIEITDFATYGAIITNAPRDPFRHNARHRLRKLRNSVVHGHYVSWAALKELQQVGAILS